MTPLTVITNPNNEKGIHCPSYFSSINSVNFLNENPNLTVNLQSCSGCLLQSTGWLMSKVPVWEQDWGKQSPEVESKTCPAGADFYPHSGPVTGQGGEVRTRWAVPVSKGHHNVQ